MEEHKHSRTSRRRRGPELYLTAKKKRSITKWHRLSYTPDIAMWPFTVFTLVIRAQAVTLFKDFVEVM
jgi:hypothetical protein